MDKITLPPKEFVSYQIITELFNAVKKVFPAVELKLEDIHLEHPVEETHGDYASNIALKLKTQDLKLKTTENPREIAEKIVNALCDYSSSEARSQKDSSRPTASNNKLPEFLEKIEIAGPGFINFWLSEKYLLNQTEQIIFQKEKFGKSDFGQNKKVMVEYSQPNPNKPMHIGHARNNFLGMTLGEILNATGYQAIRVNWINDRGVHIMKSMWGYLMFGKKENTLGVKLSHTGGVQNWQERLDQWIEKPQLWLTPKDTKEKPDHFVLNYYTLAEKAIEENNQLEDQAREMLSEWEKGNSKVRKIWQTMNQWAYEGWKKTYKEEGIKFDDWFYESDLYQHGKEIVEENLNKGIFYKDTNGSIKAPLEKYGLPDKVLLRGDGTSIYITPDLSLAEVKFKKYKINRSIYVVGADQKLYFQQLFAILDLIGFANISQCYHLAYGMVYLPEGKMSSRKGRIILADDILKELVLLANKIIENSKIGKGVSDKENIAQKMTLAALKFGMLKYNTLADIIFDPEKSITLEGESGPYLQYTYARAKSVLSKNNSNYSSSEARSFTNVSSRPALRDSNNKLESEELAILRTLYKFPEVVLSAAQNYAPNLICSYLFALAQKFNTFYDKLPILKAEKESKEVRLKITEATAQVIKNGLRLLGIETPEKM